MYPITLTCENVELVEVFAPDTYRDNGVYVVGIGILEIRDKDDESTFRQFLSDCQESAHEAIKYAQNGLAAQIEQAEVFAASSYVAGILEASA